MEAVELLAGQTSDGGPGLLLGTIWVNEGKVYNAAVLLDGGRVVAVRFKHELPNYGVFDRCWNSGRARLRKKCLPTAVRQRHDEINKVQR